MEKRWEYKDVITKDSLTFSKEIMNGGYKFLLHCKYCDDFAACILNVFKNDLWVDGTSWYFDITKEPIDVPVLANVDSKYVDAVRNVLTNFYSDNEGKCVLEGGL